MVHVTCANRPELFRRKVRACANRFIVSVITLFIDLLLYSLVCVCVRARRGKESRMQKEEEETGTKYLSIEQTTSLIGATVQRNHDDQTNPCGEQEQFAEPVSLVLFDAYLRKECEFDCKNMEVSQNSYSDDCKVETSTHGDLMLRTAALLRKRHHVKIKHVPIGRDIGEMTVETTLRRFAAAVASVMVDGVMFDETADIARMSVVVITIHLPFEDPRFAFLLNALAKSKNVLAVYIPLECVPGCDIEYMLVSGETIEMKQSGSACMLLNAMERANTALSSSSSSTREDMAPSLSLLHPMRVRQMQTLLLKRLSQFWETCKKEPFELKHIVSSDGRIQETLIRKKKKKEGGGHTLEKKPVQEHGPRKRRALIIGCDCGRNDGIIRTVCTIPSCL